MKTELSMQDKQILLNLVKRVITRYELDLHCEKEACKIYYNLSDKSDVDSINYFKQLNLHKTEVVRLKLEIKKLAKLSKELKKSI